MLIYSLYTHLGVSDSIGIPSNPPGRKHLGHSMNRIRIRIVQMLALKLNIPGNPYDHFFLITMASSRIDHFFWCICRIWARTSLWGTLCCMNGNCIRIWPYTCHICMHIWGYPYDTSIFSICYWKNTVTIFQHTSANTALEHPNMVPYWAKRGDHICPYLGKPRNDQKNGQMPYDQKN